VYFLSAVGDFGELALEEVDIKFEVISWPHFDEEEVVTSALDFLASSILCEDDLDGLQEVVERAGW